MMKYVRGYMLFNGFVAHSNREPYNMTGRGGGGHTLKYIIYFSIDGEGLA